MTSNPEIPTSAWIVPEGLHDIVEEALDNLPREACSELLFAYGEHPNRLVFFVRSLLYGRTNYLRKLVRELYEDGYIPYLDLLGWD